jgi:1-acyl-sn-glycerol-3-phosphate acyltransferase
VKEIKERFYRGIVTGVLPHVLYRIKIDSESKKKLKELKKIAKTRTDLNFVFYFNHISVTDPLFIGMIGVRINRKGKILAPMSHFNTEERPENKKNILMQKIVEACGVETHRVIQTYQVNNPEFDYTVLQAMKQNKPFMARLRELGKDIKRPRISLIISPEGTRSETGKLNKAESGIVEAGSLLAPTIYVPIGIDYEGLIKKDKINFRKRVNLSIGETFLQESRTDRVNLDMLMTNLAAALPETRQGVYKK